MSAFSDSTLHHRPNSEPPHTINEAISSLNEMLNEDAKAFLKTGGEHAASELHHTLGRYLRNKWGLWSESELARHMKDAQGITHPDDMSHAILVAYCNSLVK